MSICHPDTDWSCLFTAEELAAAKSTPEGAAAIETAEAFGWSLLASLTAYQIATCPISVRPCAKRCNPESGLLAFPVGGGHTGALGLGSGAFNPHMTGGAWVNSCGCRNNDCSCTELSEIYLPGPVGGIASIVQDGTPLPATSYRVDNGYKLVRLDGEKWPICQDQTAMGNADGAFIVTYYRGAAPNRMTKAAAGALAADFYRACAGANCALPDNVVRASQQGVDYEFEPTDFPEGVTGIKTVDALVRIYNPHKRKGRTLIASPDSPVTRTPTWSR